MKDLVLGPETPIQIRPSPKRDKVSLTAASSASLEAILRPEPVAAAIEGYILDRLDGVLAIGFQATRTVNEKLAERQEFLGVLTCMPLWSIAEAFDSWAAYSRIRATPADILARAEESIRPITKALEERRKAKADASIGQNRALAKEAIDIMVFFGFSRKGIAATQVSPKEPISLVELDDSANTPLEHWTKSQVSDTQSIGILQQSRDSNSLVQQARADQKNQRDDSYVNEIRRVRK